MNPKSLALRTDLIFDRFAGAVIDRGDYLVVRTDSRPDYFWGNCLILSRPPEEGDFERWLALFEQEIGPKNERGFVALTWDGAKGDPVELRTFLQEGFLVNRAVVLTATEVARPPRFNPDTTVRPLRCEEDWRQYEEIHFDPAWAYGGEASQRSFLADSRDQLRDMVDAGLGMRFGAELDGRIVAEAGLYWEEDVGRFNNVGTHRDHRRQGLCSTLVYEMSRYALEERGLGTLVMEADEDYHAAAIYESIGFRPTERVVRLEWFDRERF